MNCFIIPHVEKFATVIDGTLIGISKHQDYTPYHWKRGDLQILKQYTLAKFVIVDRMGKAAEVIDASALRERGVNFATAKRNADPLVESEESELTAAVALIKDNKVAQKKTSLAAQTEGQANSASEAPAVKAATASVVALTATEAPVIIATSEAVTDAGGLAEQTQPDADTHTDQPEAAGGKTPDPDARVVSISKKRRR
jgi:uncharacterized membrane protein YcgQ (UPF0703/DUF1980 family)